MTRKIQIIAALFVALLAFGCGSGSSNSDADLPEGINTQPVEPGANATPGIPADANSLPASGEPTPGIPGDSNSATSVPKGATPTPGIPDRETLKRQLERRDIDPDAVNRPSTTAPNSNFKTKDPMGRPRKANSQ